MRTHYFEVTFWEDDKYFDTYGEFTFLSEAITAREELKRRYPNDDIRIIKHTEELVE